MSELPFERLFSMGAFDGLLCIRKQALISEGLEATKIVEIVRNIDSDAGGLDFEAALFLEECVDSTAPIDVPHEFYRCCIAKVILSQKMSWARSITLGRDKLLKQLSRDEHQCFRSARLLELPPSDDVVAWWDELSSQMRLINDQNKLERARKAEKLSLEYELARLQKLGIANLPRWISIDDNTVGYDILSYDPGEFGPVNRLIEVKSTIASPLRFFITRNEWEQALKFGGAYHFHIWQLVATPPQLHQRTVSQILPHIPNDNEDGKWTVAEIPVGSNNGSNNKDS